MSDTWKQWEGQIVNGEFPLLQYLGGSEQRAVFLTDRHEGFIPIKAAIKLIPATPENAAVQLSRWQQAAELSHPHLIALFEMGSFEIGGVSFVYVVMERAEENLAQILPVRALTPGEARTMLESVLDVLDFLHHRGFVHGQIKPANIMASGDQLKISSDGLRRSGESLDGASCPTSPYDPPEIAPSVIPVSREMLPAGDVWSLGMTLVETLTQNLPVVRTAEQEDPLLPQALPEPFLDTASHCLRRHPGGRWTVAQIAARLEGRDTVPDDRPIPDNVQAPLAAPEPIARPSRPSAKRRNFAIPIAVGFLLALAVILAGAKLLRHTDAPESPTATDEHPLIPPTPTQLAPSPQGPATTAPGTSFAVEQRESRTPVPESALVHSDTIREEETNTVAELPAGSVVHGEVTHKVILKCSNLQETRFEAQ